MKPDFEFSGVKIFQGDCIQLLQKIPSESIDLVVTSPPYNIGKEYESVLDVSDYLSWCEKWISELFRVVKPSGSFWLNLGYLALPNRARAIPISYLLWDRIPFFLMQEIVWAYGAGVATSKAFSPRNEKFLWYVKDSSRYTFNLDAVRDPNVKYPNQKKNGKLKCNPLGKNPTDVWQFPKVTSGTKRASKERTSHPAQFPTAVIDRIVKACSNKGDTVLDPFFGSGTTGAVCILNERKCVGMELRSDYVAVASQRISNFNKEIK